MLSSGGVGVLVVVSKALVAAAWVLLYGPLYILCSATEHYAYLVLKKYKQQSLTT
jgi:hypothetical protein